MSAVNEATVADAVAQNPASGGTNAAAAVLVGTAMTLALRGYQFGQSNHTVYLVEAVRRLNPELLAHDWWATSTLQYHFAFTHLAELLLRLGVLEPASLLGYLALAVLLHAAWLKLTLRLGGNHRVYLLSVVLYYISAGGLGLGTYHFLQDSAFLPSNIANVAMLWGLYFWIVGRFRWSGACLGVAGLFHLNHAIVGIGMWGVLSVARASRPYDTGETPALRQWWIGSVLLVMLSLGSIVPAIGVILHRTEALPLAEFVALYVKLRHPHHYDPLGWHWGLWVSFLWVVPIAVVGWRGSLATGVARPLREAIRIAILFGILLLIALLFAGMWFVSESLVQMSLWRFSIFVKLLTCIGAAAWLARWNRRSAAVLIASVVGIAAVVLSHFEPTGSTSAGGFVQHNALPLVLFFLLVAVSPLMAGVRNLVPGAAGLLVAGTVVLSPGLGLRPSMPLEDDAEYLAMCDWAREHTAIDAVFLVPPDEESMRLHGQRAIVVNFKGVPQLSGELPQWRDRLAAGLAVDDLSALPRPVHLTLAAIRQLYDELPAEHLLDIAMQFRATHIIATRPLHLPALQLMHTSAEGQYLVYALDESP